MSIAKKDIYQLIALGVRLLYNATQAAKLIGLNRTTFYYEVQKGYIPVHRTPGKRVNGKNIPAKHSQYHIKDLIAYAENHLGETDYSKIINRIKNK